MARVVSIFAVGHVEWLWAGDGEDARDVAGMFAVIVAGAIAVFAGTVAGRVAGASPFGGEWLGLRSSDGPAVLFPVLLLLGQLPILLPERLPFLPERLPMMWSVGWLWGGRDAGDAIGTEVIPFGCDRTKRSPAHYRTYFPVCQGQDVWVAELVNH